MTLRLIIGIDPGVNGAIALLQDGVVSIVYDMPIKPRENGGNSVDAVTLSSMISDIACAYVGAHIHAVIEQPGTRPHDAPTNILRIGEGVGKLMGVLASHGIAYTEVRPQTWKAHHKLLKCDKGHSRDLAIVKWPSAGQWFARIKDHDRAEAALIADWGNTTECWVPKSTAPKKKWAKKPKRSASAEMQF